MKITGEKMRLVSLAFFQATASNNLRDELMGAIASQDASMNDCIFMDT
jgi:hypothetical protein